MSNRLPLLAASLLALGLQPAAVVAAATFILHDGEVVEGRVVAATRNTLTVHSDIGGLRQIPAARLARVRIGAPGGGTVSGVLKTIEGGRIAIETDAAQVVWIENDRVQAVRDPAPAPAVVAGPPESSAGPRAPAQTGGEKPARPAPGGTRSGTALAEAPAEQPVPRLARVERPEFGRGLVPGRTFGGLVPQANAAVQQSRPTPPAEAGPPLVRIEVSDGRVTEDGGEVGFRFELSHPVERPIRLVYSTVDGQAAAGSDYEAQQGVATLPPGVTTHAVQARVLDDGDREDPEEFFLFVTTDAELATIEEKWHTVTIEDDD